MGAEVSCSLFEKFSSALHWYTEFCSQDKHIIHYLDDFLFGGENDTTVFRYFDNFSKSLQKMGGLSQIPDVFRDIIRHSCDGVETSMREIN
jgi:hypothetical protein